ncbi:MAG: hypothetical protein COB36_10645 [Alphaproteobacteria bacterium]|nr:MAG: hypothetical protein COB36_10645 [Alphaproteobacteria bacterium]
MTDTAPEVHSLSLNETRNVAVSMVGKLDSGETLTGTPTIAEVDTSDLTLTNKAVSTKKLTINGEEINASLALQFTVSSSAKGNYTVNLKCSTDGSQIIDGDVTIIVC